MNFLEKSSRQTVIGVSVTTGYAVCSVGITSVILKNKGVGRIRNHLNGMSAEVVLFERMLEILSYKF